MFQASRWTIVGQIVANTTSGDLWFRITKKIYFLPPPSPLSRRNDNIWHKNFHNFKAFNARWLENWIKSQLWQIISPWILIIEFRTFEQGCPKLLKIYLEEDIYCNAMWRFKVFHVARLIHICAFYTSYTFSTRWKEMLKFIQSFYTLMYIPPDIHNIMICLELNISYMKSYPRSQGQRRNHDLSSWTTTMISEQIARWLLVAKKNIGSSSLSLKRW